MTGRVSHGFDPRRSIVARLTLSLAAIAVLVFAVCGALLYWTLQRELMRFEFDEVQGKIDLVQRLLAERPGGHVDDGFRRQLDDVLAGHGNLLVWIHAKDGTRLFGNAPEPLNVAAEGAPSTFILEDGRTTAGCRVEIRDPGPAEGARVTVAMASSMRGAVLAMYGRSVAWICALGTAAAVALAAWATRRGFRPVRRLSEHAARITPGALSVRLPLDGNDNELRGLAVSFNHALDRLQEAYARLEAFNADVAHELRTPLASLISGIEITLAKDRPKADLEHLHATNLELLRRLGSIVNDMLFLARADVGEQAVDRVEVSLADEAARVVEYYEALLAERGARVVVSGDARVRCNPGLVRRALSNLLSNAIRHADPELGRPIGITLAATASGATVLVRNHGATVPAAELPRIFDRFYRGEPSRAKHGESNGLGLAIVRGVASMHGGGVEARSSDGITEVGFRLAG